MQNKEELLESELQALIQVLTEETQANASSNSIELSKLQENYNPEMLFKKAAEQGYLNILSWLVENKKVEPQVDNNHAIRYASRYGHATMVSWLLKDERVNPQALDNTPIGMAAQYGHYEVVEQLLADPRVSPEAKGNYAVRYAAMNGHREVVTLLMKDSRVLPERFRACKIHWAVFSRCSQLVQLLLRDVANNPNKGFSESYLPINRALDNNLGEVTLLLLQDKRVIIDECALRTLFIRSSTKIYRELFLNKSLEAQKFLPMIFFMEDKITAYLWYLERFTSKFLTILPDILVPQNRDEEQKGLNLVEKLDIFLKQISEIRNTLAVTETVIACPDEQSQTLLNEKNKFLNQLEQALYEKGVNLLPEYNYSSKALEYWLDISPSSPYYAVARFRAFQFVYNGHIQSGEKSIHAFKYALPCCITEQNNFIAMESDKFFNSCLLAAAGFKADYNEMKSLTSDLRTLLLQHITLLMALEELEASCNIVSSATAHGMFSNTFANSPEVMDIQDCRTRLKELRKLPISLDKPDNLEEIVNGTDNNQGLWDLVCNFQMKNGFKDPDLNQLILAVSKISNTAPKNIAVSVESKISSNI